MGGGGGGGGEPLVLYISNYTGRFAVYLSVEDVKINAVANLPVPGLIFSVLVYRYR